MLVHGLGTGDLWWTPTISVLAQTAGSSPNLAGFGRTAGQPVRLDVAADQLAAWAAAIGLERATFVGHSMGGLVTADLAARYPEVVERLVLVDAAGLPISQRVTRHLMNFVRASPFMPVAAYPIAVECVLRCGPLAIMRASHQLLTMDLTKRLRGSARRPGSCGAPATTCCRRRSDAAWPTRSRAPPWSRSPMPGTPRCGRTPTSSTGSSWRSSTSRSARRRDQPRHRRTRRPAWRPA